MKREVGKAVKRNADMERIEKMETSRNEKANATEEQYAVKPPSKQQ